MKSTKESSASFPCGVCNLEVGVNSIECCGCQKWIHRRCVRMDIELLKTWGDQKKRAEFRCPHCAFTDDDDYDATAALNRLYVAVDSDSKRSLSTAVHSERLLVDTYEVTLPPAQKITALPGETDRCATRILELYMPAVLQESRPIAVLGDGSCLYRAVSRGLYGHEDMHTLIRLLTALEIAGHKDYYDASSKNCKKMVNDADLDCDTYNNILRSVCRTTGWGDALTIFAVSAVLRQPLSSYCPPTLNGRYTSRPLNRVMCGRGVRRVLPPVMTLMWSMMRVPPRMAAFMPNHFVLLHKVGHGVHDVVDLATDVDQPHHSTPNSKIQIDQCEMSQSVIDGASVSSPISSPSLSSPAPSLTSAFPPLASSAPLAQTSEIPAFPPLASPAQLSMASDLSSAQTVSPAAPNGRSMAYQTASIVSNSTDLSDISQECLLQPAEHTIPLPEGKFLDLETAIRSLYETETPLKMIPCGKKENVFVVVDNKRNIERRSQGKRSEFVDDCGVWDSAAGSSPKFTYVADQQCRLTKVYLRDDQYCTQRMIRKKVTYVPLQPQPPPDTLLDVHRVYSQHKADSSYRRRVTYVTKMPNHICDHTPVVALVEYTGRFPGAIAHGNQVQASNHYIRTQGHVMDKVAAAVKGNKPRAVYKRLELDSSENSAPRNLRQVQNKKYREKKKELQCQLDQPLRHGNLGNQIQHVETLLQHHPFVQRVYRREHPFSFICRQAPTREHFFVYLQAPTREHLFVYLQAPT